MMVLVVNGGAFFAMRLKDCIAFAVPHKSLGEVVGPFLGSLILPELPVVGCSTPAGIAGVLKDGKSSGAQP